jgi:hypothetical protein
MNDLETAKKRLRDENLTLSIVSDGKVLFETVSHGISPFLDAVETCGSSLEGASVADRVVGKAVALLCVEARVCAVYALTMSRGAEELLAEHEIRHEWETLVDSVLGTDKRQTCPFERVASQISNPRCAYEKLRACRDQLLTGEGRKRCE